VDYPGDQTKKIELGKAYGTTWERRGKYMVFVAKPEGKKPLGRLRCMLWKDNIKN
jgi:hypothetical protein